MIVSSPYFTPFFNGGVDSSCNQVSETDPQWQVKPDRPDVAMLGHARDRRCGAAQSWCASAIHFVDPALHRFRLLGTCRCDPIFNRKLKRSEVLGFFAGQPP
ncbi:hypothetical protein IB279_34375 [Ensifer sp. ENS06]|uniref:hypothetical protein n=1 Tax=Ensifer sp. ENS06 TaxID=2769276 RepID=UPI00177D5C2F|nr:hypothetical protein [Ensifer sp. ENS06]MBD9628039.1 hypothetical protein [Ensifer sp. ENS06]